MLGTGRPPTKVTELTVVLLWHSPNSGNMGVQALTYSQVAILQEIGQKIGASPTIVSVGWGPGTTIEVLGQTIEHIHFSFTSLLPGGRLYQLVRDAAIVLDIGEGDSFATIYGYKRFLFLSASKFLISVLTSKLILSPQTIGPFEDPLARLMALNAMKRCNHVFARDGLSINATNGVPSCRTSLSTDLALRLPYTEAETKSKAPKVGVNVNALIWNGGYKGGKQVEFSDTYQTAITSIVNSMKQVAEVVLIPHVLPVDLAEEDDYALAEELADKWSVSLAPRFENPVAAKSYISGLDCLFATRMHACIAAISSGVATLPIAYSRKFRGLFASLQYPTMADLTSMSQGEVIELALDTFERREYLSAQAKLATERGYLLLAPYKTYLESALEKTKRK